MAEKSKGSRAHETMTGHSKSKSHKHVHKMHIRHAQNGGFIAEHEHEPDETGMAEPNEEHIIPAAGDDGTQALQQHMAQHMSPMPMQMPAEAQ